MKKQKSATARDRFLPVYLTVVIVCVFGICMWLMQLHKMMLAYEASMPKYAAENVLDQLRLGDYDALYQALDPEISRHESKAQFTAFLKARLGSGELSYEPLYSSSPSERRYKLTLGDAPLAELVLSPMEQPDAYGNVRWEIGELTNLGRQAEYLILAQDDSTVYVDDVAQDASSAIETLIPTEAQGHLPSKVHTPTLTKYRVKRSFSEPRIRVVDAKGQEQQLVQSGENAFEAQINYDEALKKSQKKRAVEIAKAYGQFTIGRKSKTSLLSYILGGTKPYTMIHQYDDRWYIKNKSYQFKNVKADKFYAYSKNCYSCVVSYDLDLVAQNGKTQVYPTSITLYLYKKGSFKIYDWVIGQSKPQA